MRLNDDVQAALISYIKAQTTVTSLLTLGGSSSDEVRECEWQGVDFKYPNIRVAVNVMPSINGCGPDKVEAIIEAFSEQKSSREADSITAAMARIFHKHPFSVTITLPNQSPATVKFPIVVVREIVKADRTIYGWKSQINLSTQVV